MSKETAFLAAYPALAAVLHAADHLLTTAEEAHEARKAGNIFARPPLEVLGAAIHDLGQCLASPTICEIVPLSGGWLSPIQEGHAGFIEALGLFRSHALGSGQDTMSQAFERLALGHDVLDLWIETLAHTAFGPWGAEFFFACADQLPECYLDLKEPDSAMLRRLIEEASGKWAGPFVPTTLQDQILRALDGRVMKKEDLAAELYGNPESGRPFYRTGGIKELMARGLVLNRRGVGYYRPDALPSSAIS